MHVLSTFISRTWKTISVGKKVPSNFIVNIFLYDLFFIVNSADFVNYVGDNKIK